MVAENTINTIFNKNNPYIDLIRDLRSQIKLKIQTEINY